MHQGAGGGAGPPPPAEGAGRGSRRRAAPPPPPQAAPPPPLHCPVCNHGTEGACLHAVTGDCTVFNEFGVCPPGHAPCRPNPCPDVRAPCYDPASSPTQPVCAAKEEARCRVLDPTGNVCLSHACPPGLIESQSTRWQTAFYPDNTWYGEGIYDDAFLITPGQAGPNNPQVWMPAGSGVVLPTSIGAARAQRRGAGHGRLAVLMTASTQSGGLRRLGRPAVGGPATIYSLIVLEKACGSWH